MAGRLRKTLPKHFDEIIASGDVDAMKAVFESCELNARGGIWKSPAISFPGVPETLISWLVAAGADLEVPDEYGDRALHHHAGAWNGNPALLLELGADIEARDERGRTPLHAASIHAHHTSTLIAAGADIGARDDTDQNPLLFCLRRCDSADIDRVAATSAMLVEAGTPITDEMRAEVRRIGEGFEWMRDAFAAESLDTTEAALRQLYELFAVEGALKHLRHDGIAPITVSSADWAPQYTELWECLVPAMGPAATVQGEVIRIVGRVRDEIEGNGSINWDNEYRAMLDALPGYVVQGVATPDDLTALRALLRRMRAGRASEEDVTELLQFCTRWVVANPVPVQLSEPAYIR